MSQRTAILMGVIAIVVFAIGGFWYTRSIQLPSAMPTSREGSAAWKTYQYAPYAFEIQYPSGWGLEESTNTLGYHNVAFLSFGSLRNTPPTGDYYVLVVSRLTPKEVQNILPVTSGAVGREDPRVAGQGPVGSGVAPGNLVSLEAGKPIVLGNGIQGVELDTTPDYGPNAKTVYIQRGGFIYYLTFQAQTGGDTRRVRQHGQFSSDDEALRRSILATFRFLE